MITLLKELCAIHATSSREQAVRDYIIPRLGTHAYHIDAMGNLIVEVKGKKPAQKKVMVCAHMDEVGLMATYITDDGFIRFQTVGGIQTAILLGTSVIFENGTVGTVVIKPVHLVPPGEKTTLPDEDSLFIDIGTFDKKETERYVQPGDTAVFNTPFINNGNCLISRAIDDRAGCAVMLKMIETGMEYDTVFVFNVQEEVGLRGAGVSAFSVNPDYAIVLEATTAADIIDVPEAKQVCCLNRGAVVSFMDRATLYSPKLYQLAFETAQKYNIAVQAKTMVAGGNDAGAVHKCREGIKTLAVSVPCRYIHSGSCLCHINDIFAVKALAEKMCEAFNHE